MIASAYPIRARCPVRLFIAKRSSASPSPRTSKILDDGSIAQQVMADGTLWGGEPSVNPVNPAQYVFAGQLIAGQSKYNEDLNYIWFADASTNPEMIRPLDQKTPTGGFNSNFQGRAPWWSPDGKWVAFSNRLVPGTEGYAIYIQDSAGASAPMQVLDTGWSGNHAKWFPSGTELVVSVLQIPGIFFPSPLAILPPNVPLRGIASLDVSAFVGNARS